MSEKVYTEKSALIGIAITKARLLDDVASRLEPDAKYTGSILMNWLAGWANEHRKHAEKLEYPDDVVEP